MKQLLLFLSLQLICLSSDAQADGSLDLGFGISGIVTTRFDSLHAAINDIAVQSDGKIIAAGTSYNNATMESGYTVARYFPNGNLDNSFGKHGVSIIQDIPYCEQITSITLQPDGKILAAGVGEFGLDGLSMARYNTNGSLDSSFGVHGTIYTSSFFGNEYNLKLNDIIVQADGKIIGVGSMLLLDVVKTFIVRYHSNGEIDTSFNKHGFSDLELGSNNFNALVSTAIQKDGKILCSGYFKDSDNMLNGLLIRYESNGKRDLSFGSAGIVSFIVDKTHTTVLTVKIQSDEKILLLGFCDNSPSLYSFVQRYNTDGTPDNSFGTKGIEKSLDILGLRMELQTDQKILIAGGGNTFDDFGLKRLNSDGSPDLSFGSGGKVITILSSKAESINSIVQQADGKILVSGTSSDTSLNKQFLLARYNTELKLGMVNFDAPNKMNVYPNPLQELSKVRYELNHTEHISIRLLDIQGRTIKEFVSNEERIAGAHEGALSIPANLPSGTYFLILTNGSGNLSVKLQK